MQCIFAVIVVCMAAVQCQMVPRPPPSGMPVAPVQPPRPRGCSPGCGDQEICAKLGRSYCTPGQPCHVCVEMSSIRFPSAALSSILGAQRGAARPPPPVAPQPPQQPPQQPLLGGDFLAPWMLFDGFGFF